MSKYRYYYNEPVNSLVELTVRAKKLYADEIAVAFKKDKQIQGKTYNELYCDATKTARFLMEQNLSKGHIAILGQASYEWIVAYLGVAFAGLVVVPLDKELPVNELSDLLAQSETDLLFYDEEYKDVVASLQGEYDYSGNVAKLEEIHTLKELGNVAFPEVDEDKLFAILYTSGTTGKAKGVMLSQRNIARNTTQGLSVADFRHGQDVMLSVLPFNHAYGFTCTILAMIYKGVKTCISSGLKYIKKDMVDCHSFSK